VHARPLELCCAYWHCVCEHYNSQAQKRLSAKRLEAPGKQVEERRHELMEQEDAMAGDEDLTAMKTEGRAGAGEAERERQDKLKPGRRRAA
jgi:hypothetical protein